MRIQNNFNYSAPNYSKQNVNNSNNTNFKAIKKVIPSGRFKERPDLVEKTIKTALEIPAIKHFCDRFETKLFLHAEGDEWRRVTTQFGVIYKDPTQSTISRLFKKPEPLVHHGYDSQLETSANNLIKQIKRCEGGIFEYTEKSINERLATESEKIAKKVAEQEEKQSKANKLKTSQENLNNYIDSIIEK